MRFMKSACGLIAVLMLHLSPAAEQVEFHLIWGYRSRWHGELTVSNGRFLNVEGYSFEGGDNFLGFTPERARWESGTGNAEDGLMILAEADADTVFHLKAGPADTTFTLKDIPETKWSRIFESESGEQFVLAGLGDIWKITTNMEPKLDFSPVFKKPAPGKALALPDDWSANKQVLRIRLPEKPKGEVRLRRASKNDGRLYLEVMSDDGSMTGEATVSYGDRKAGTHPLADGRLWLSLAPRIDLLDVEISFADSDDVIRRHQPTTLVETRGRDIWLNGEIFLMKGTLPRDLKAEDAEYIRSIGMNCIRGRGSITESEDFGFMALVSGHAGPGKIVQKGKAKTDEDFLKLLEEYVSRVREFATKAADSPYTLIYQVANEQTGGSPWGGRVGEYRPFERLDYLIRECYNLVKQLDPMIPVGYANHEPGYVAPDFLEVYQHNSFMNEDRYGIPWEKFMRRQGCLPPDGPNGKGRPFVNSEWGANTYLAQTYHGGPNNPIMEKINAWNYTCRWETFMEKGTVGGTSYCMYDLDAPKDQGCSRFGIMTEDSKVKLACWNILQMWRDFEIEPVGKSKLSLAYRRDYHARNVHLTVAPVDGEKKTIELDDFKPHEKRVVDVGALPARFRWTVDFTTHQGLVNQATGALPKALEEADFLERLSERDTYPFLKELFDTEILTVEGKPAPPFMAVMKNEDGVIPMAFRKPDGVVYLTLITRESPRKDGPIRKGVNLEVAFKGDVVKVDDMTGAPLPVKVEATKTADGMALKNIEAARIPRAIGGRSSKPFMLPVYRITP